MLIFPLLTNLLKIYMLYFYVYTGTNYEAGMKLNVLDGRTSCYSIVCAMLCIAR